MPSCVVRTAWRRDLMSGTSILTENQNNKADMPQEQTSTSKIFGGPTRCRSHKVDITSACASRAVVLTLAVFFGLAGRGAGIPRPAAEYFGGTGEIGRAHV